MSNHRFLSAAFIGIAALALTTSAANAATTVPAVKAASPVTKAPAVVTPSVKAPVIATKAPTLVPATKAATAAGGVVKKVKPVKVGNFCKKVLVGKTALDGAGATVKCVANTKGQPVWTV